MKTVKVAALVSSMRASLGDAASHDLMYEWLAEAIALIRDMIWPWNWSSTSDLTYPPETEQHLGTWNAGDNFVTVPAVSLGYNITGRFVLLGEEYYRVIDAGNSIKSQYIVDRKISSTELVGAQLVFIRPEIAIRTTKIKNVQVGIHPKITRYDIDRDFFDKRYMGGTFRNFSEGTPYGYIDRLGDISIDPPEFPPVVTSSGLGAFTTGQYRYFYTLVDPESGLESPPGPETIYDCTDGFKPRVTFGTADALSGRSYYLRLYRSEVNMNRDRPPMYMIQERDPDLPPGAFADTDQGNGLLYNMPRYWDGPQTVIQFIPPPDSERRSIIVDHLNNWYFRPGDRDQIDMGIDNMVVEAFRMYLSNVMSLAARDADAQRKAIAALRAQLLYYQSKVEKPGDSDYGPSSHSPLSVSDDNGDWVDRLEITGWIW